MSIRLFTLGLQINGQVSKKYEDIKREFTRQYRNLDA